MTNASANVEHTPISAGELDRLSELLERYGDPDSGLTLEGLDGFFSAVAVGPGDLILPAEYLPEIFDREPQFETREDAFDTVHLLTRMNNHVVWRLAHGDDGNGPLLQPLLMMPVDNDDRPLEPLPDDLPLGAAWALGFMRAAQLRATDWQAWCASDDGIANDFSLIVDLTLVMPEQLDDFGIDAEVGVPVLADRELIVAELGSILLNMTRQRAGEGDVGVEGAVPLDLAVTPCPCGSGRLYGACCGAPARSLN